MVRIEVYVKSKSKCCTGKRPAERSDTESCESDTESPGPSIGNQKHCVKVVNVSVEPVFPNVLNDSLSPDTFDNSISNIFLCSICQGIPNDTPYITYCEHIFVITASQTGVL